MTSSAPNASRPQDALRPRPPLPAYFRSEEERRPFLRHIFDDTAADYDRIEGLLAFGSGPWYRRQALQRAGLAAGAQVLDVGIGTGLVAREALAIVGPAGGLVGVDPSPGMLAQVRLPGVELLEGSAEALPRPDGSHDFASMGYALRHVSDIVAAFAEFHRVLRPGGRLLLLEISKPAGRAGTALLRTYMRGVVPLLARLVSRRAQSPELWRYYWDTIEACVSPEQILSQLRAAGFEDVRRTVVLGIFSEYTATRR